MSVEVLSNGVTYDLGEGPHWEETTGTLLFVDAFVGDLHRLDPFTGKQDMIHCDDSTVTLVVPCASDRKRKAIFTRDRAFWELNWETKGVQFLKQAMDDTEMIRFNDGKCDVNGRLWAGTMSNQEAPGKFENEKGCLFRLDGDLSLYKKWDKISLSNGMAWTKDGRTMFFVDSVARHVYAFDFNMEAGEIANKRILLDYNKTPGFDKAEVPDGMTIDVNDKLWVACWDGGRIINVDSETGQILRSVKVPAPKITSCCFGGLNFDELYVTSARKGLTKEQLQSYPNSGALFKITGLGVKGLPAPVFHDV